MPRVIEIVLLDWENPGYGDVPPRSFVPYFCCHISLFFFSPVTFVHFHLTANTQDRSMLEVFCWSVGEAPHQVFTVKISATNTGNEVKEQVYAKKQISFARQGIDSNLLRLWAVRLWRRWHQRSSLTARSPIGRH
jgi:hypothetical protein